MQKNVESTFLVASLLVSHSKTSKGEAFLWPTTAAAFEGLVELWSDSADVLSDGPLMLRVIIWWEDAKVPTAHEKSPDGMMAFSMTESDFEVSKSVIADENEIWVQGAKNN